MATKTQTITSVNQNASLFTPLRSHRNENNKKTAKKNHSNRPNNNSVKRNKNGNRIYTLRLRLKSNRNKTANNRNNKKNLTNSNSIKSINANITHRSNLSNMLTETNFKPLFDEHIADDEFHEASRDIVTSERRALYYKPYLSQHLIPFDDTHQHIPDSIVGLIIHFPNNSPMAFDHTTTLQYEMFPLIESSISEEHQPILLITQYGFQQIRADDIRGKYNKTLTELFTKN
jgi:hypothetical protein